MLFSVSALTAVILFLIYLFCSRDSLLILKTRPNLIEGFKEKTAAIIKAAYLLFPICYIERLLITSVIYLRVGVYPTTAERVKLNYKDF
jgi:hypothetical protein